MLPRRRPDGNIGVPESRVFAERARPAGVSSAGNDGREMFLRTDFRPRVPVHVYRARKLKNGAGRKRPGRRRGSGSREGCSRRVVTIRPSDPRAGEETDCAGTEREEKLDGVRVLRTDGSASAARAAWRHKNPWRVGRPSPFREPDRCITAATPRYGDTCSARFRPWFRAGNRFAARRTRRWNRSGTMSSATSTPLPKRR